MFFIFRSRVGILDFEVFREFVEVVDVFEDYVFIVVEV